MGPRRHDQKRRHGEDLPGLRRLGEPAEALGRHVVQPAAAGRSVAQPAVGRAGQLHAGPEEEDPHPPAQKTALLTSHVSTRERSFLTSDKSLYILRLTIIFWYFIHL